MFGRRRLVAVVGSVVAMLSTLTATPAQAAAVSCRDIDVPVRLGLLPQSLHGRLCVPTGAATVQVLVHGGTYNGSYWDFPYQPETYSYAQAANRRGYATFTVDRLGYGQSTRPLSALLTGTAHANVVHQVVGKLRAGAIGGVAFPKILLAGHSLGSAISTLEAATYHDVDGVLLTGMTHHLSVTTTAAVLTKIYPAALDPKFGLAYEGYLTTMPGTRKELFYAPGDADPGVVAFDEQTKEVLSATELPDLIALGFEAPTSLAIDAPVMVANGTADSIFCQGLLAADCSTAQTLHAAEAAYFSPAACLQTYVLPGAGHNLNLSTHAQAYQSATLSWADQYVGAKPGPPPVTC